MRRGGSRRGRGGRGAAFRMAPPSGWNGSASEPCRREEGSEDDGPGAPVATMFDKYLEGFTADELQLSDSQVLGRTRNMILDILEGRQACIICMDNIGNADGIWSCGTCYCIFHLPCIQSWARTGPYNPSDVVLGSSGPLEPAPGSQGWSCPKCRTDYPPSKMPREYRCFCGKEENPTSSMWRTPHTCAAPCGKDLLPSCGHLCMLDCHPGPCPPCPQQLMATCFCGEESMMKRCNQRHYTCGEVCKKELSCGAHRCEAICHDGPCQSCHKSAERTCRCGATKSQRPCEEPQFLCDKVCGKKLLCGKHTCEEVCHPSAECGACPREGPKSCPCGKDVQDIPCDQIVRSCGDTCGKMLECNKHECSGRCHTGPCLPCRSSVKKRCNCRRVVGSAVCGEGFSCKSKCLAEKNCGRHQCKKKCCLGGDECTQCNEICGRRLRCGNCKCTALCHSGVCFPCPKTVEMPCNCGHTVAAVPCGREKILAPPKCSQTCTTVTTCHHAERERHRCHFGPCPKCKQTCGKAYNDCEHACSAPCHDPPSPTVLAQAKKKKGRRAKEFPVLVEKQRVINPLDYECRPCPELVPRPCLGDHETREVPCASKAFSCTQKCGAALECGNHSCPARCHVRFGQDKPVPLPPSYPAATACTQCTQPCRVPRDPPCAHPCSSGCHPGDCDRCPKLVKRKCHCGTVVLKIACYEVAAAELIANTERLDELGSCGGVCHKTLPCQHMCPAPCHPGPCPNPERCRKKTFARCQCNRRKRDLRCSELQAIIAKGGKAIVCDDVCEEEAAARRAQEASADNEDVSEDGNMIAGPARGKKRKKRKQRAEREEEARGYDLATAMKWGGVVVGAGCLVTGVYLNRAELLAGAYYMTFEYPWGKVILGSQAYRTPPPPADPKETIYM